MSESEASRNSNLILGLVAFEGVLKFAPLNPLAGQCAAGARAGNVSGETARAVYQAMLAADELDC